MLASPMALILGSAVTWAALLTDTRPYAGRLPTVAVSAFGSATVGITDTRVVEGFYAARPWAAANECPKPDAITGIIR
jgi:hypothetical protein